MLFREDACTTPWHFAANAISGRRVHRCLARNKLPRFQNTKAKMADSQVLLLPDTLLQNAISGRWCTTVSCEINSRVFKTQRRKWRIQGCCFGQMCRHNLARNKLPRVGGTYIYSSESFLAQKRAKGGEKACSTRVRRQRWG